MLGAAVSLLAYKVWRLVRCWSGRVFRDFTRSMLRSQFLARGLRPEDLADRIDDMLGPERLAYGGGCSPLATLEAQLRTVKGRQEREIPSRVTSDPAQEAAFRTSPSLRVCSVNPDCLCATALVDSRAVRERARAPTCDAAPSATGIRDGCPYPKDERSG